MSSKQSSGWIAAPAALMLSLAPAVGCAQYDVYSWDSFEAGTIPKSLKQYHLLDPAYLKPLRFDTGPELLPGIRTPLSLEHCGRSVLCMATPPMDANKATVINSLISDTALHRPHLGEHGKALVQADFHLVDNPTNPILAVLAYGGSDPIRMYRFGVMKGILSFFSFAGNDGAVQLFKSEPLNREEVGIPGWHRFQIIFEGQEKILCAIDGKPTTFSPLIEPTLTDLRPGLMMTPESSIPLISFVDNLSIQWTTDDVPIPRSPWRGDDPATRAPAPGLIWLRAAEQAWIKATTENRPLLVLFFAPTVRSWPNLESLLGSDPATREQLSNFVLLKMDTNQLQGGSDAHKVGIHRLPSFVVLGPDGATRQKLTYSVNTPWPETLKELAAAAAAAPVAASIPHAIPTTATHASHASVETQTPSR